MAEAQVAADTNVGTTAETNAVGFNITTYVVEDHTLLPTNNWNAMLSHYTGTNVSLDEIVQAATAVQTEYRNHGYPNVSIAIPKEQVKNGIVTLNVFQTAIPQIVVSGIRYYVPTNVVASSLPAVAPVLVPPTVGTNSTASTVPTTTAPKPVPPPPPIVYATPEQIAAARVAMFHEMTNWDARDKDTRVHVVSTNAGPHFAVEHYDIVGNSILTPPQIAQVLTNIDGVFGTNVTFDGIRTVVQQLQAAYRDRGYITVAVGLPRQKLTNATVKVQVTEGWLASIDVKGNRYFSSNNVMRALPSLHTNILLNGDILQGELNRANVNQDRQIYPVVGPGPDPGSSALTLNVKDQFPFHGKLDFNNQSTPDTPALRLNSSAVYDNLWQLEHQVGVQYSFSPEEYKQGDQWDFYDKPLVANYSAFYRIPLGNPEPAQNIIANNPSFGYSEATRKFNMPALSGSPDITFLYGRSTIDTGIQSTAPQVLSTNAGTTLTQSSQSQDITITSDAGAKLSIPLQSSATFSSVFSGGLDIKNYKVQSAKTNIFTFTTVIISPPFTNVSRDFSAVPYTVKQITYTPLTLRYDGTWQDDLGVTTFGLGLNVNLWYSSQTTTYTNGVTKTSYTGQSSLQQISGSTDSHGNWVIVNPSFSRTLVINNWTASIRADGQWASEPLISNEQYGIGGVNSVRGYHEGEIFGDNGWHVSLEEDTPPHIVGEVYSGHPLTIQGSVYMDAATAYLIDPYASAKLWGTGVGLEASVGTHWQAQFLFSVPLISAPGAPRYDPFFNFELTAQF